MNVRLRVAATLPVLVALHIVPMPAYSESLRDALATAYSTSAELRAERARLREIDEHIPQALANSRPTIQAFSSIGAVHETSNLPVAPIVTAPSTDPGSVGVNLPNRSYGVTLTEPVYRGGRTVAEYREARDLVAAERAKLLSVEQRVLLQAATSYAELLRVESLFRLASEHEATQRAQLAQAQGRFAAGALVRTDLLTTQSTYELYLAQLASARAQLTTARSAYTRDIGRPPGTLAFPDSLLLLPTTEQLAEEEALAASPDIKDAERTLAAAIHHVQDVRGEGLPTAAVQASLQHQEGVTYHGEISDIRAIILQLRVPLYAGGAISSRVRAALADVDVQRATLDRLRETTVASVVDAWTHVAAAHESIVAYEAQQQISQLFVKGTQAQLDAGERTLQDVRSAEQTLVESQVALIGARRDLLIATFTLAAAVGNLTAAKLKLPVEIYDPDSNYRKVHYGPGR